MQIYLAVTPAEAQEASRFRCSLAHVAYCIGPDSTLLRQNLLLQTRGGLLSVTDRGAPFIASPERLSAAALRECGRRSYGGVLLDFDHTSYEALHFLPEAAALLRLRFHQFLYAPH